MSFLGALSSFNPLSAVGKAVESACDAILPPQLEFMGDIASGVANFYTGNYAGMIEDALDLLREAPQQLAALANRHCQQEPPAPPASHRQTNGHGGLFGSAGTLVSRIADLARAQAAQGAQAAQQGQGLTALTEAMRELITLLRELVSSLGGGSAAGSGTGAAAGTTGAATAAGTGTTGANGTGAGTTGATNATSTSGSSRSNESTGLTQDARDFLALADSNPEEFMRRVRAGDIPESLNTTQGMMALQANLQHISEMNRMMSQLLDAMHRMSDGILNNLRV